MPFRFVSLSAVTAAILFAVSTPARAQTFTENFDRPAPGTGRILFDASPSYDGIENSEAPGLTGGDFNGNVEQNGRIVATDPFNIARDQSGTGFFLFAQTRFVAGGGGTTAGEVWGTITPVTVLPNSLYSFSFYLTNQNTVTNALIQPFINGISLGGPVSATGMFSTNGWQRFAFNWNSGAATTADLSLVNQRSGGSGNDFGIDTIAFAAVPEPGHGGASPQGIARAAAPTGQPRAK